MKHIYINKTDIKKLNIKSSKHFYIETWGCQMNEEDSEKISGMLKSLGYLRTGERDRADVIIFNTCCIRENAENKVNGNLGELKALKKKNPSLIIAICGCMMQQKDAAQSLITKFPYVDIIFGTHNAHKFPEYLNTVLQDGKSVVEILDKEEGVVEGLPIDRASDLKAFVTIMYGCNNFCTYCVVPSVRGRERSRKYEDILNEVNTLVSEGYKEVTLLGQNVNSYGKDLEDMTFAKLLRLLNEVEGLDRVRFMTSHPRDLTDEVIEAIKECDKVCNSIHLPVQSGSTAVLKKMNRHYDREHYLNLVKKIKKELPGVTLTTDIIVGFPGETEEDFEDTMTLVNEVRYDSAFTFIYSRRNNTVADRMEEQIPEDVKHTRFNRLLKDINRICAEINKEYENKTVSVLVEGPSKNDDSKLCGRTSGGKLVNFEGHSDSIGKVVDVLITEALSFSLNGKEVK